MGRWNVCIVDNQRGMTVKVLLINPSLNKHRLGSYWRFTTAVPPTGLAYLAAVLEQDGFQVAIYDQHALHENNENLMELNNVFKKSNGHLKRIV